MSRIVWAALPQDPDDEPCTATLFDGDDYLVRLKTGEVVWATWTVHNGAYFARLDDAGAGCGEHEGDGISGVVAVMVSGYTRHTIATVLGIEPTLTDRVVTNLLSGIPAAMARAKQLMARCIDEPVTSSEREQGAA